MTRNKLKSDMMILWQRTFHDTPEYVRMVFDAYFNPDFCAWRYEEDRLVAALLGVPYSFGSSNGSLQGLYLCGLATEPAFRGHGVMSQLLEEINQRARKAGFSFTFLIPADRGLQRFYQDRGYSAAIRNVVERYTAGHSFFRDYAGWVKSNEPRLQMLRLRNYEKLRVLCLSSDSEELTLPDSYVKTDNLNSRNLNLDEDKNIGSEENENIDNVRAEYDKIEILENDDFINSQNNVLSYCEFNNFEASKFNDLYCSEFNISKGEKISKKDIENLHSDIMSDIDIIKGENNTNIILSFDKIFNFINRAEVSGADLNLIHSSLDLYLVIKDCKSSGGEVLIVSDRKDSVVAMAFVMPAEDRVTVKRLYSIDPGARFRLLQTLADRWPDKPIEIVNFPTEVSQSGITDAFYGSSLPEANIVPAIGFAERVVSRSNNAEMYGMVRILQFSDFLKFLANDRRDAKFSIFIKDPNSDQITAMNVNRGEFSERVFTTDRFQTEFRKLKDSTPILLSPQQIQALLFRKSENEDAVTLAFGLPALPMNMAMLLD